MSDDSLKERLKQRLKGMKPAPPVKPAKRKKNPKMALPPTKKQLGWLRTLGYTGKPPRTKGAAGLLIARYSRR